MADVNCSDIILATVARNSMTSSFYFPLGPDGNWRPTHLNHREVLLKVWSKLVHGLFVTDHAEVSPDRVRF